jgi:hypothetical protein
VVSRFSSLPGRSIFRVTGYDASSFFMVSSCARISPRIHAGGLRVYRCTVMTPLPL